MLRPRIAIKAPIPVVESKPEVAASDQWAHLKKHKEQQVVNLAKCGEFILKNVALANLPCEDTGLSNVEFVYAQGQSIAARKILSTCEYIDRGGELEGRSYYLLSDIWKLGAIFYEIYSDPLISDGSWDRLGKYLEGKREILRKLKIIPNVFSETQFDWNTGSSAWEMNKPKDQTLIFFLLHSKKGERSDGNAFEKYCQEWRQKRGIKNKAPLGKGKYKPIPGEKYDANAKAGLRRIGKPTVSKPVEPVKRTFAVRGKPGKK